MNRKCPIIRMEVFDEHITMSLKYSEGDILYRKEICARNKKEAKECAKKMAHDIGNIAKQHKFNKCTVVYKGFNSSIIQEIIAFIRNEGIIIDCILNAPMPFFWNVAVI